MASLTRFAAVVVLAAVLASCSSDTESEEASLTGPTSFHRICVSDLHASQWTLGLAIAFNHGDAPVSLVGAALTDVDGVELIGTEVIRPRGVDTFGVWNGYPPRDQTPLDRSLWRSREELEGNRVDPGEKVNFLLHVRGEPGASAGPLQVTYRTESGEEQTYLTNVQYLIEHDCNA